jgi:hypothetical protein
MICRLYGVMDDPRMRCPFGCEPERWLSEQEAYVWLARVEEVSRQVFPSADVTAPAQGLRLEEIAGYITQARTSRHLPGHTLPRDAAR